MVAKATKNLVCIDMAVIPTSNDCRTKQDERLACLLASRCLTHEFEVHRQAWQQVDLTIPFFDSHDHESTYFRNQSALHKQTVLIGLKYPPTNPRS
jgi:hypothetical protein